MVIPGKLSLKTLAVIASVEAKAESKSFFNRIPQFLEQLREKVASDITMTKGESPSEQLNPKAFTKMLKDVNYATISELAVSPNLMLGRSASRPTAAVQCKT